MSIAADLDGNGVSAGLGYQSYRMSRIATSVVARILALGNISLLPYGLAAGSLLAYAGLLTVAVRLTDTLGLRAMMLGLSPAAMIGTIFDTSEGLGSLLLTVAITTSSIGLAVLSGALLGVSRPSYGTGTLAARTRWIVPTSTLLSALLLQVLLVLVLDISFAGRGESIVVPFTGYIVGLPGVRPVVLASASFVLLMTGILVRQAFDPSYLGGYRLGAASSALLSVSVGPTIFVGPMSPLRISGGLFVLVVLSPMFRMDANSPGLEEISADAAMDSESRPTT